MRVLAHHVAADDIERVGRRLQEFGRHIERLLAHVERGDMRRRRRHHRGARGVRADAERDAVGLAVNDAAILVVDAECIGGDLRHHRLKTLADRGAAGDHLDHARSVDGNIHAVGRTEAAFLDEHRNADADQLARGLAFFTAALSPSQPILANSLSRSPI